MEMPTADSGTSSEYQRLNILVVEDDWLVLGMITDALRSNGYFVKQASNGLEALEMMTRYKPDLVILDVVMPRMDGYRVMTKMQESEELRNIPFIVVTCKTQVADVFRGASNFAGFIAKPFRLPTLFQMVKSATDRELQAQ